jgi:hypothetical protein
MAPRGRGGVQSRGRAGYGNRSRASTKPDITKARARGNRIQKVPSRGRASKKIVSGNVVDEKHTLSSSNVVYHSEARDTTSTPPLPGLSISSSKVTRKDFGIHACSELSLQFVVHAGLETNHDANTIALNLVDYFLFSEENWLPELSYCKLHAACFLFASHITGLSNTSRQVAASLAPDSEFVQLTAAPLAEDEETALAIQEAISVSLEDVMDGYRLLYDRRAALKEVVGEYEKEISSLPPPDVGLENGHIEDSYREGGDTVAEEAVAEEQVADDDFDLFDEEHIIW